VGGEAAEVEEDRAPVLSLPSRDQKLFSIEHVAITLHAHSYCSHSATPKMTTCRYIRGPGYVTDVIRIYSCTILLG